MIRAQLLNKFQKKKDTQIMTNKFISNFEIKLTDSQ